MSHFRFLITSLIAGLLGGATPEGIAYAAERTAPPVPAVGPGLQFSRLFNDHMVLQRDKPVNVWGWAVAGQDVCVEFAGKKKGATTADDGRWRVRMDAMAACSEGRDLVVRCGTEAAVIHDVLVGEVWLLGGQSNMSCPVWIRSDGFDKAQAEANPQYRLIRCVSTLHGEAADPSYDNLCWIQRTRQKELPFRREWVVFGSDCLNLHALPFCETGFFFAKNLYDQLKVPIGLVDTSVGGTLTHHWAPAEAQQNIAGFEPLFKEELWVPGCLYNTTIRPIQNP